MPEAEPLKVERKSKGTPAESNATERPPIPNDDDEYFYRGIDFRKVVEIQFTEEMSTPKGRRWRICLGESGDALKGIKLVPRVHGLEISCEWPQRAGERWSVIYPWELGIICYMQRTGEA